MSYRSLIHAVVTPLVSVVMTVRDGARWLRAAIASVLTEKMKLELFVVDDASVDETPKVLEAIQDPRVVKLRLEKSLGPFGAANLALDRARGTFIARLDADDLNVPGRFSAQLSWLDANPKCGLLGTACEVIDEAGETSRLQKVPLTDADIRTRMLMGPPFVHSSVIWLSALQLRYDPRLRVGGDYELWSRALDQTVAANLDTPWVKYRRWSGNLSVQLRAEQRAAHDEVSLRWLAKHRPELQHDKEKHLALRRWAEGVHPADAAVDAWIATLGGDEGLRRPLGAWGQP